MTKSFLKTMLFFIMFLYIVGPTIVVIPHGMGDLISITSALLCYFLLIISIKKRIRIPKKIIYFLVILVFLTSYSALITLVNGSVDMFVFFRSIRALLNFLGGIALVLLYKILYGEDYFDKKILIHIFWVLSLHGFIMVVEFLSHTFQSIIYQYTKPEIHPANILFRVAGLTNGAGAQVSFLQAISIIIIPLIWFDKEISSKQRLIIMIAAVINFTAMIVSGRTGIYFVSIFFPLMIILNFRFSPIHKRLKYRKYPEFFLRITEAIVILLIIIWVTGYLLDSLPENRIEVFFSKSVNRTFEALINFNQTGIVQERTIEHIASNMLFFPENPLVFLFGNSNTGRGDLGLIQSDVGYVRLWFALGLIGAVFMYGFYVMTIYAAYKGFKRNRGLALFLGILSVMLLIANGKEIFVFTRYHFSITTLILVCLIYKQYRSASNLYIS